MKTCEQLREEEKKLQNDIEELILKFIDKNGLCDISISIEPYYWEKSDSKELVNLNVNVDVTI